MDDKKLLELATILSSVIELQIKQSKTNAILVAHLGVQDEVERAQNLLGDSESQALRSLRERIQSTVHQLSKSQNRG